MNTSSSNQESMVSWLCHLISLENLSRPRQDHSTSYRRYGGVHNLSRLWQSRKLWHRWTSQPRETSSRNKSLQGSTRKTRQGDKKVSEWNNTQLSETKGQFCTINTQQPSTHPQPTFSTSKPLLNYCSARTRASSRFETYQ